ncbi:lanthionine synthetase LanC family protein [Chitinophaga filiformis]|uniref:Protein kinase n=1 Tax=Chitinophaga filiformis TaxID=104663 RepID=A0ABY4HXF3_CHIFI|nr:lanthionine synthetase LanC family protein [Chitinophaga filiformis]UPK68070.1 protein kinase [Chitinophaga filiformis]
MTTQPISATVEKPSMATNNVLKKWSLVDQTYLVLSIIKEDRKGSVYKCLYIKGIFDWGICILKEANASHNLDAAGRNNIDRLLWQANLLKEFKPLVPVPRIRQELRVNGNLYLPMEYIKGKTIEREFEENNKAIHTSLLRGRYPGLQMLDYLKDIISSISRLHEHGYVHRDITASNFIVTRAKKVVLIDPELSYSINRQFPTPPFELGTLGYMSPEQLNKQTPTFKEDIFAMGALIIRLLTGIDPYKIVEKDQLITKSKLDHFIGDDALSNMLLRCFDDDPDNRPSLEVIKDALSAFKTRLRDQGMKRQSSSIMAASDDALGTIIQSAIDAVCSPLMADDHGWFSFENNSPNEKVNPRQYRCEIHNGAAGVLYLLSVARQAHFRVDAFDSLASRTWSLLKTYLEDPNRIRPGLYSGSHGIAMALHYVSKVIPLATREEYDSVMAVLVSKAASTQEIKGGLAGKVLALLTLVEDHADENINEELDRCIQSILDSQNKNGSWKGLNGQKTSISLFTGTAGILLALIRYLKISENPKLIPAIRKGLHWLQSRAHRQGNSLFWSDWSVSRYNEWLYNGGCGIALTYIKAFEVLGDSYYRDLAYKALQYFDRNIIHNNLSHSYGLTGLGEVYLEAYKVFRDPEWLERAKEIVQHLLCLKKSSAQSGTYWLIEKEPKPIASFTSGNAGIIHFLIRYSAPYSFSFPFLL